MAESKEDYIGTITHIGRSVNGHNFITVKKAGKFATIPDTYGDLSEKHKVGDKLYGKPVSLTEAFDYWNKLDEVARRLDR